ncbi:MAG: tyrosine--tRNA ligase [Gemmatimonadota bacterium]
MTDLLSIFIERGLLQDMTPGLEARLGAGPIAAYAGFDPTADSLHVGNLVPVMGLAWLQRTGGRPVVLVGGGTGLVGDPSGKKAERPMLAAEEVAANAAAIRAQLAQFLDFDGPNAARMVNNADWLTGLTLMEFLRETGKYFTLGYMLQKESVRSRLETGISFTEFTYMLIQAYDFWHLHRTMQVELQMGGSDQWGNITAGIELIAKKDGATAHALVFPLITTASGAKFGKSEGDNIWLDPARTSPYRFYQFWLNTDDRDVERYLRLFTFLPLDTIAAVMREHDADRGRRVAQRRLAEDVTTRVHGAATTQRVIAASRILFGGADLTQADAGTFEVLAGEVPTTSIASPDAELVDVLVTAGLAASKSEAKKGLQQGGFSVNGAKADPQRRLSPADLLAGRYVLLQKGKKNYALLVVGGV